MNMNRITKYLTLAAALLALAGCNKELAPEGAEMTVEASVSAPTKVSAAGDAFTAGDQIAVYAWLGGATQMPDTRVVDGVVNTFDGASWTPATMMRWQVTDNPHYFLGVSPAPKGAIADLTAVPYTLDPAKYAESDLLLATTPDGVKNTGVAVPLEFRHAMAKLSVNLKFRKQWATKPDVSAVTVTAQSTANVNYLTQTVTATGVASAVTVPEVVSVASGYDRSFSGLHVPQTGVRKITVTIDGKDFIYEAGEDITLAAGRNTTLNLIVGRDKIELAGISLNPWTAESPLSEGEMVSANRYMGHGYVDMGEVDVNGVKKHLYWATCNIGAENSWDYGDYYAWGETTTKDTYAWGNYAFMQAGQSDWKHITKYTFADGETDGTLWYDGGNFIGDGKTDFAAYDYADDAARRIWGGDWRIPTDAEWTALRDASLYDWVWKTDYNGSGKNGMLVTRKTGTGPCAGNSIFLPAAGHWGYTGPVLSSAGSKGYYWSSSLSEAYSDCARDVLFSSDGVYRDRITRYYGQSLRPVLGDTPPALGDLYYSDGTSSPELIPGKTPIGVIAYLGTDSFTENGTNVGGTAFKGHGLVLCLKNAAVNPKWSTEKVSKFPGKEVTDVAGLKRTTNVSGYINTLRLTQDAETAAKYPAAAAARSYVGLPAPAGTTGWFLPSIQQWVKIMEGLGGLQDGAPGYEVWFDNDHVSIDRIEAAMAKAGAAGTAYDSMKSYLWYWASTERSADETVDLGVRASGTGSAYGLYWSDVSKTYQSYNVRSRPVLAF